MKQSDIFTLIIIASVGVVAAFFACNALLGDPSEATAKFKTVSKVVTKDLVDPDPEIFNVSSVNPTVEVYVGGCEDIDQNGILDQAEIMACSENKQDGDESEGEGSEEDGDENNNGGEGEE